ncbi:MAG: hypothetical protein R3F36_06770 [Candidatus Competibacteraceae bacterium]
MSAETAVQLALFIPLASTFFIAANDASQSARAGDPASLAAAAGRGAVPAAGGGGRRASHGGPARIRRSACRCD